jgi:leader peptidase (prepilin peptidase)/N-methyltransferase
MGDSAFDIAQIFATLSGFILLGILAVSDAKSFRLPIVANLGFLVAGIAVGGVAFGTPLVDRLIGAGAGFLSLSALALIYRVLRGRTGIGGGDPILLAGIGSWIGWQLLPITVFIASATGVILAIAMFLTGKNSHQWNLQRLPFGTMLAIATILVMSFDVRIS